MVFIEHKSTNETIKECINSSIDDLLSDDFINQIINEKDDFKSNRESIDLWCEQLFNPATEATIESSEMQSNESYSNQEIDQRSTNCFIRDAKVSTELNTNNLMSNEFKKMPNVKEEKIEFADEIFGIHDHTYYLKPIANLSSNEQKISLNTFNSLSKDEKVDKPLNSFDDFSLFLNVENNAFQNSNPDLFVN